MTLDVGNFDHPLADLAVVVGASWQRGWALPEPLMVSEWADRHRMLTREGAAEPGLWSTDRTPYLREIMDVLSDEHPCKKAVLVKCTQVGGTEVLNNFAGYIVHHTPGPTMVVMPTEKLAQRWSKQRLAPMISASPALNGLIASAKSRDGGNTTLMKEFPGGLLVIAGANSASDLRSMPARRILADEVDEYPDDLDDQGEPLELAERRASTFVRRKVFVCSSPKLKATSVVWREYMLSDQRRYHVPCPHCEQRQALVIDQLTDDGRYVCVGCGQFIEEHHKPMLLALGKWVAENPGSEIPGFHINAMYAPIGLGYTWLEIAQMRAAAERDPAKQVSFTNTILGLPFEGERIQQDPTEVQRRAEPGVMVGVVPHGGYILTIGVDCQHDRFEAVVVAWGRGQRAWVVDYAVIEGDPSKPDGYGELDAWLQRAYAKHSGALMVARAVAIDGGNWTEQVAQFIRAKVQRSGAARMVKVGGGFQQQFMYVVRGRSSDSDRVVYKPRKTEVNAREKTIARSVGVWGVGTDVAKHILFGRIAADGKLAEESSRVGEEPYAQAAEFMIRFPGGTGDAPEPGKPTSGALDAAYYEGLTCEYFDLVAKRWIKPKNKRNEPVDTLVYAYWAALCPAVKIDLVRDHEWAALEASLEPVVADLFAAPAQPVGSRETPAAPPPETGRNDSRETNQRREGGRGIVEGEWIIR
ncbi:phage terminase large subunit family protein [Lysobacter olei]